MKIYHYDRDTGEFIGASDAVPDPLEYQILVENELEKRLQKKNARVKDLRDQRPLTKEEEKTVDLPEPTKFLVPGCATTIAPPSSIPDDHVVIFQDGGWIIEEKRDDN